MPRIAIVGPGAVGSVIAACLHEAARHEIILCARRPLPELRVRTPSKLIVFSPQVLTEPERAQPVDWVLVTTKAYDAAGAAAWLQRLAAGGVPVAILQNGVEHRERFAGCVPPAQLLPVMVDCPAERSPAGSVTQRGAARLVVPDDLLGRAFVALFDGTTVAASTTPDFTSAIWRKLCLNAAGVINALLLQPAGVMHDAAIGELAQALVREGMAVARAEGAVLPDDLPETIVQNYRAAPRDGINSLHADRLARRPTEIDARNGVIVRLGRKHGIAAPCNAMAVALLNAMCVAETGAEPDAPRKIR
jgi:2-dehydropantoate 2-reductase